MGITSTGPVVAAAARNDPQTQMVLVVADKAGARRRVAVSPTRHLSSNNLTLVCVYHAGGYNRRLPAGFFAQVSLVNNILGIRNGTFVTAAATHVREAIEENRS